MSEILIFVSYSHEDSFWVQKGEFGIVPWLAKSLKRKNIEFWFDRKGLEIGDKFKEVIEKQIAKANFVLLLISQDFMNSDFIRQVELPLIRKRVENNEISVIPILVGPVIWEEEEDTSWLFARQMLPGSPTPLVEYKGDQSKWQNVRIEILDAIKRRIRIREKTEPKTIAEKIEQEIEPIQRILHDPTQASDVENKLTAIMEKYPDSPLSYYYLGRFYNERGKYETAVEIFNKGMEKKSDNALLYWGITMAYLKQKNFKFAIDSIKRALELGLEPDLEKHARSLLRALQQKYK